MSLQNLRMKSRNPQQRGNVRGGADPSYIPGIGSQSNSGSHGSASGPNRMVPSKKSPLGPGPSNKPLGHKRTEEGGNRPLQSAGFGDMSKAPQQNKGERMQRYNTENQRSRERCETVPSNLYAKKSNPAHVTAAIKASTAPYGRTRPADSSRSCTTAGRYDPQKGQGRARGMNIWYPNKGIAASGDSGESQRSSREE